MLYVHRFADLPFNELYFNYIKPICDVTYVDDVEVRNMIDNNRKHYVIILKDRVMVNDIKTGNKYIGPKGSFNLYVNGVEDYHYNILCNVQDYSSVIKDTPLLHVFIDKEMFDHSESYIKLHALYGMLSGLDTCVKVSYVNEFSTDYVREREIVLSDNETSNEYFIVHNTNWKDVKLMSIRNGTITNLDYRILSESSIRYLHNNVDPRGVLCKRRFIGTDVYIDESFDTDVLFYYHLRTEFNKRFNIINVINADVDSIVNDLDDDDDRIFLVATAKDYKVVQVDRSIDETYVASFGHEKLDFIINTFLEQGGFVFDYIEL
jgi:hypothetical protein